MNTVRKLKRECTIERPFMLPHCWWSAPHCMSLCIKSVMNSSNSQVERRDLMDAVLNFFIQLWMSIGLNISQIQSSVVLFQDCQLNLEENISGLRVIATTEKSKLFPILSSRHRNMESRSGHPTQRQQHVEKGNWIKNRGTKHSNALSGGMEGPTSSEFGVRACICKKSDPDHRHSITGFTESLP